MILEERDLRRLLFVMRTASQLPIPHRGLEAVPEHRFTEEILTLNSNMMRIHLVVVGGRTYVSHLSDAAGPVPPSHTRIDKRTSQDCELDESNYLAVRSDETGVIDIAFQRTNTGPKWILKRNVHVHSFQAKISVIRCADTRRLRIIRDVIITLFLLLFYQLLY